ncbi:MAG TPA: DUF4411 family protein [Nevskiaceae bacterium]|nr:DUF4411 family protein [Nevskiaceae bacterium]
MSYLLDANVFMAAHRLHYGMDFCPAFWDWLVHQGHTGTVFSIDKVADEIDGGDDPLTAWARNEGQHLFRRTPPALAPQFAEVSQWVTSQQYTPAAINTFMQVADYYLVVHALAGGHTVVTHETPSNSRGRVKIPDACLGVGVRFVTPYQMLRTEKARFVLGGRP